MNNESKSPISRLIIIIAIAILLFAGGIYFGFGLGNKTVEPEEVTVVSVKKEPVPTIVKKTTIEETTTKEDEWKNYTNTNYDFSVSYPSDWDYNDNSYAHNDKVEFTSDTLSDDYVITFWAGETGMGLMGYELVQEKTVSAGGVEWQVNYMKGISNAEFDNGGKLLIVATYNTHTSPGYLFMVNYIEAEKENIEDTFEKILDTFKFL